MLPEERHRDLKHLGVSRCSVGEAQRETCPPPRFRASARERRDRGDALLSLLNGVARSCPRRETPCQDQDPQIRPLVQLIRIGAQAQQRFAAVQREPLDEAEQALKLLGLKGLQVIKDKKGGRFSDLLKERGPDQA